MSRKEVSMNVSSFGGGWQSFGNMRQSNTPKPKAEKSEKDIAKAKWEAVLKAAMKDGGPVKPVKVRPREG